jgi:hypothetical protein
MIDAGAENFKKKPGKGRALSITELAQVFAADNKFKMGQT